MRSFAWLLVLVLLAPPVARADGGVWRVQSGEILSRLAVRFGVSVAELRLWNELESDRLVVGQELQVEAPSDTDEPGESNDEAEEPPKED